ncbi:MAG: hypothetical protein KGL51_00765 [Betaproteobacteria bacterium]|nr:hypothetical protein [Betaproteobacteria bacterium]MDE2123016.1 hypothetical protein [Betaproteobacteria bacterium]MDE2186534.1 hypothetical protein [Betaproteobacteria bacterium]MDE2323195.1 hypothetical protein [Betaproteobacteria bacterium]
MELFGKLFKRTPPPCALEAYVSKLTPGAMDRLMQGTKGILKIPTAQAMTVLLFAGMFAKGLHVNGDRPLFLLNAHLR